MEQSYLLETRGDPLGALNSLYQHVWTAAGLDRMVVPAQVETDKYQPRLLHKSTELHEINPFAPVMYANTARFIPSLLREKPGTRYGAILRPCEMRALTEVFRLTGEQPNLVLTICADCLGTYPAEEIQWRTERKLSFEELSKETLQFARQGGIVPYRYRSACQMCVSPQAYGADINIGVIGLPVRQFLLITVSSEAKFSKLDLSELTSGIAGPEHIQPREVTLAKLVERHGRTREGINDGLANLTNLEVLLHQLETCGGCHDCLDNCPICSALSLQKPDGNHYEPAAVIRWLLACAGCGMCEQACQKHLPLTAIFGAVRHQLRNRPL